MTEGLEEERWIRRRNTSPLLSFSFLSYDHVAFIILTTNPVQYYILEVEKNNNDEVVRERGGE